MGGLADFFSRPDNRGKSIDDVVGQALGLDPTLPRRPTLLPLAADAQGNTVAAWPQVAVDLAKFFMLPGHAAAGGDYTPQDVTQAAMSLAGPAAGTGAALAPKGAIGMFAGKAAKTARPLALETAQRMERAGADADAVRGATSWFRGPDNAWRWEIDDSTAALKPEGFVDAPQTALGKTFPYRQAREGAVLGDVLAHPELFSAYPDLAAVPVSGRFRPAPVMGRSSTGSYNGKGGEAIEFSSSDPESALSTLLHEAQHAIQQREGFAKGGMPTGLAGVGWDDYARLAGEVEAKDVQARRTLTQAQRKVTPPALLTAGAELIVR